MHQVIDGAGSHAAHARGAVHRVASRQGVGAAFLRGPVVLVRFVVAKLVKAQYRLGVRRVCASAAGSRFGLGVLRLLVRVGLWDRVQRSFLLVGAAAASSMVTAATVCVRGFRKRGPERILVQ